MNDGWMVHLRPCTGAVLHSALLPPRFTARICKEIHEESPYKQKVSTHVVLIAGFLFLFWLTDM